MTETVIMSIIVCSCIVVVVLIIAVATLITNYQDNISLGQSYASFRERCDGLDKRMDDVVTRMTVLEIKVDESIED